MCEELSGAEFSTVKEAGAAQDCGSQGIAEQLAGWPIAGISTCEIAAMAE
jgi:hypothetical protein